MNIREQIRQQNVELMRKREEFERSLPKFVKDGIRANIAKDGRLELYADGLIPDDTVDMFIKWIQNNFIQGGKQP